MAVCIQNDLDWTPLLVAGAQNPGQPIGPFEVTLRIALNKLPNNSVSPLVTVYSDRNTNLTERTH